MNHPSSSIPLPPALEAFAASQPEADRAALEEAWALAGLDEAAAPRPNPARKAATWAALDAAMMEGQVERQPQAARIHRLTPSWSRWAVAAAVAVLLVATALTYLFQPVTLTAPNGSMEIALLPDGSEVQLNSGSTLVYSRAFLGQTRDVRLEGEAFFSVAKGERPFVVETFNATTTVLGTRFNVRARPAEHRPVTSVIVEEGRVRLASSEAPDASVVLTAGEASTLALHAAAPTDPDSVALDRALAWRSGDLAFSQQPFALIFEEIARRYDVTIAVAPELQERTYNYWKRQPGDVENVLADLTGAAGLHFRAIASGYEVY